MKKGYLVFGFFVFLSGCAGMPVAQNATEAMQFYGSHCTEVGYKEGTEPYGKCILASWNIAVKQDAARRERLSGALMMMGQGMKDAGDAYSDTYNSWRSPTTTHCIPVGNAMTCTSY